MAVVGIISNSNNIIEKENKIQNDLNEKNIILINEDSLENVKSIKFDVIVIYEEMKKTDKVKEILKCSKNIIINTDFKYNIKLLDDNVEGVVITFGFNSKSTITIVSNENEEIILEIQREFKRLSNEKIECQEIKLKNKYGKSNIYEVIAMKILTFLLKI